ncbi:MAG: crossover junction endodeoxyribonuclease RuvC [Flavobacteriales bacterium]|jgi:crossover junction endodeoxyribonuclease RuvC|nr:crossover junction endodeoxyribonuclease RuvC [Flavobacteriales bacterium]|tara:strand:+ start:6743 stop:7291 length:549 start_codon:yes stop_codon:yes gene_type:complete
MKKEKIILGIDPGTNIMGYGVIKKSATNIDFLYLDVIILNKTQDHHIKLKKIFTKTTELIKKFSPDEVAIEAPFFGKNPQSMLKLGRAQGAAIIATMMKNLSITEYAPKKIKMSITGNGQASKEQVAGMLINMLKIDKKPKYLDSTDGLAAAVCHALQNQSLKNNKKPSWEQFIKNNPGRVK